MSCQAGRKIGRQRNRHDRKSNDSALIDGSVLMIGRTENMPKTMDNGA